MTGIIQSFLYNWLEIEFIIEIYLLHRHTYSSALKSNIDFYLSYS